METQDTTDNNFGVQPQKRGRWTAERKWALLDACKEYNPYGVDHGSRTEQWDKMLLAVNKQDSHLTPLKRGAMIDQLKRLFETYKDIFEEYKNSPASRSDTVNPDMLPEGDHVEKDKHLSADQKGDKGKKKSEEAIAPGGSGPQLSEIMERLDKNTDETRQMRQEIITLTKVVLDVKSLSLK
ncbi:hypothetical protein INT47_009986 [Mucor saturninus]|uniref:Uncharacterized protein n=1 Tax=Mucor saturninus TaxID=64648 RepID=A0A8H7QVH7_9FUNG|nr:hypothetical protein INT47_009986 [Mucor saturninus]